MITQPNNKKIKFIFHFAFAITLFISSVILVITDGSINLSKAKCVIGEVNFKEIRRIKTESMRYSRNVFYFRLTNSNENFAVERDYHGYQDLQANIKIADTLKVYFNSSRSTYNLHVFQIEKGDKILIDFHDYKNNASDIAGTLFVISIFYLIVLIILIKKFNVFKFLIELIEK